MKIEKGFKFIDLFCGIGGFHQAMTSLGGQCVFASDIDRHCQQTYKENYGIDVAGDITKIHEADIPSFDVLCAGFPCQTFSVAGKKLGFEDTTRGTLFFDIMRIAKYHKPRYMLLENVKNLLSHDNGNTWNVIYNSIKNLGYNLLREPVVFSPHFIGIPQLRERVFIMCVREDVDYVPEFVFDRTNLPHIDTECYLQDDSEIENLEQYKMPKRLEELCEHWEKLIKSIDGQIPCSVISAKYWLNVDEYSDVSKYPTWQQGEIKRNLEFYNKYKDIVDGWLQDGQTVEMFKNSRLTLEWHADRRSGISIWEHFFQLRQSGLRVKRPTSFPTLVAVDNRSYIGSRRRCITPRECARIQSFPESFKINPNDRIAYKQFGNSVNVDVVKIMAKFMFGDEETRNKYTR